MKVRISITVDDNLVEAAKKKAAEDDRTFSWICNKAIEEYLKKK